MQDPSPTPTYLVMPSHVETNRPGSDNCGSLKISTTRKQYNLSQDSVVVDIDNHDNGTLGLVHTNEKAVSDGHAALQVHNVENIHSDTDKFQMGTSVEQGANDSGAYNGTGRQRDQGSSKPARKQWTLEQQMQQDARVVTQAVYTEDGTRLFGLDAELEVKMRETHDPNMENNIIRWLEKMTEIKIVEDSTISTEGWRSGLEDGVLLCTLVNIIRPDTISAINEPTSKLAKLENLRSFQAGCKQLNVPSDAKIHVSDLHKGKNLRDVLHALENFAKFCDSSDEIEVERFQVLNRGSTVTKSKRWQSVQTKPKIGHISAMGLEEQLPVNHGSFKRNNGRVVYGMDAEQCEKEVERRIQNKDEEKKLWVWIEGVVKCKLESDDPMDDIRSGIIMCQLANTIWPGSCTKYSLGPNPLSRMDNLNIYLKACVDNGVDKGICFTPSDIEESRYNGVLSHILQISRVAALTPGFKGPYLEPAHEELAKQAKTKAMAANRGFFSGFIGFCFSAVTLCTKFVGYVVISPVYVPYRIVSWAIGKLRGSQKVEARSSRTPLIPKKAVLDQHSQRASYGASNYERDETGRWRAKSPGRP
ncbi:hypothetical protein SARC_00947 [Sphaeroforma arctica JP610]|uniref:Calponin-homology (CH) domain-containing protein n=1 Tax=Sphaeroforma arctica JP610 TaxID=667725 RepID=A0A0L0GD08_9EUKA|nr:hypothetical protein SARC_00947 [Sphaeroforma arctica JP610]KNC86902.1 hypothetical protein SARC_00947 [Sphaeroforma arctica JP610]|eukprot:XP_014160804.1 hypothetical protein SARC_00947 [Sphaeroforma arctica JP610]